MQAWPCIKSLSTVTQQFHRNKKQITQTMCNINHIKHQYQEKKKHNRKLKYTRNSG